MRVISGIKKGHPLQAVPGINTRPTTDKVKESMFNLLAQPFFRGGWGLDLYAGTGGLGIEALSRGMDVVIFVDQNRRAVEVIKQNLASVGLTEQSEVYRNEAGRALKALAKRDIQFDLIFLDPPYQDHHIAAQLTFLDKHHLLQPSGCIIVETKKGEKLPERVGQIRLYKYQTYGDTEVRIYQYESEAWEEGE